MVFQLYRTAPALHLALGLGLPVLLLLDVRGGHQDAIGVTLALSDGLVDDLHEEGRTVSLTRSGRPGRSGYK